MRWAVLKLSLWSAWWVLLQSLGLDTPDPVLWLEARPWAVDAAHEIARVYPAPAIHHVLHEVHRRRIERWRHGWVSGDPPILGRDSFG